MTEPKNILLAGASGFIGRNILEQLGNSYNFYYPGHKELDLLDSTQVGEYLTAHKFDVVIHSAGSGVSKEGVGIGGVLESNKKMFLNLAQNNNLFGKMIFLGSGAEYGKQRDIVKIKESAFGEVKPQDEYGEAKYFASEYISSHENIINLRCFGVFGKYEQPSRFISSAILDVLAGRSIAINQNVFFDYLYVDNLVQIINYFITHEPKNKFYNAASGRRVDLVTLAGIVEQVSGSKKGIEVLQDGLGKEYTADNSRLMEEIPTLKFTDYPTAIAKLYEYNQNLQQ